MKIFARNLGGQFESELGGQFNRCVQYGSKEEEIIEIEIGFLLNENGQLILGIKAPKLFKAAITNLSDFRN